MTESFSHASGDFSHLMDQNPHLACELERLAESIPPWEAAAGELFAGLSTEERQREGIEALPSSLPQAQQAYKVCDSELDAMRQTDPEALRVIEMLYASGTRVVHGTAEHLTRHDNIALIAAAHWVTKHYPDPLEAEDLLNQTRAGIRKAIEARLRAAGEERMRASTIRILVGLKIKAELPTQRQGPPPSDSRALGLLYGRRFDKLLDQRRSH